MFASGFGILEKQLHSDLFPFPVANSITSLLDKLERSSEIL